MTPTPPTAAAVLRAYLDAEQRMLALDAAGREDEADDVRDQMDDLWDALSGDDHAMLDARSDVLNARRARRTQP